MNYLFQTMVSVLCGHNCMYIKLRKMVKHYIWLKSPMLNQIIQIKQMQVQLTHLKILDNSSNKINNSSSRIKVLTLQIHYLIACWEMQETCSLEWVQVETLMTIFSNRYVLISLPLLLHHLLQGHQVVIFQSRLMHKINSISSKISRLDQACPI